MEPITLVEFEFDSGTRKYSHAGVKSKDGWYADKIVSAGSITREVPLLPGESSISSVSVTLDDSDAEFRILRGTEAFRNRVAKVKFGDALTGLDNFTQVYTGRITDWHVNTNGDYVLNISDPSFDRFSASLDGVLLLSDFPAMPPLTTPVVAPIIYGEVTSSGISNRGAVPCYLVTQTNPYRYLVAQHACKAVDGVYLYGSLVAASGVYNVTESVVDGKIYTFIDFTTDQRDVERPMEYEITADVRGKTDTGISSGDLITNPIEALKDFLINHCSVLTGEIGTSFATASTSADDNSYVVGAWIGGPTGKNKMDVINTFARSFLLQFFTDRLGKFGTSLLIASDFYVAGSGYANITDRADIVRNSFSIQGNTQLASKLQYLYSPRWQDDVFTICSTQTFASGVFNLGQTMRRQVEYPYVRDLNTAHKVSATRLLFMREDVQFINVSIPPEYHTLDLCEDIYVTHFRGVSSDGLGYQEEVFRILSLTLPLDSSPSISARCVRIPDDPEYGDSYADVYSDSHSDIAYSDTEYTDTSTNTPHEDSPEVDQHYDYYIDGVFHPGYHVDQHYDDYTDQSHGDESHVDTHADVAHADVPHADESVATAPHDDFHFDTDTTPMFDVGD